MSTAPSVLVVPRPPPTPMRAIRWVAPEQWKDIVAFAGNPIEDPNEVPNFLFDSDGREFVVGCWLVQTSAHTTRAYTDSEFFETFVVVRDVPVTVTTHYGSGK